MKNKIEYWVELSDYDFETAKAMLETGRYLYVGFMCHQTVEKLLKAYFTKTKNETPPFVHSLLYLSKKSGIMEFLSEEFKDTIDLLEPLNIESRYPTYKERLFKSLTQERCFEIISKTDLFRQWIKEML
ncbi:HEPN domain-containing protein [Mariniphaga sp.]|uniref:HEPN domain-containing protein n=1 Tax=Mariniphaga sp. TaxID=1954475 RepID=UPI003567E1EF